MKKAIYPGTFDPITLGHIDIIERAAKTFDSFEVAVAISTSKSTLFSTEERCRLVSESIAHLKHVKVIPFDGLLVDFAKRRQANVLIRGLRGVTDFSYEIALAHVNRRLDANIETLFLMTAEKHTGVSSSMVREIHKYSGDYSSFVPPAVMKALQSLKS